MQAAGTGTSLTKLKQEVHDNSAWHKEVVDGIAHNSRSHRGAITVESKSLTSSGLKEVIMSLEDELSQYQQPEVHDQCDEDGEEEYGQSDDHSYKLDDPESPVPPSKLRPFKMYNLKRKGPMRKVRNLTYSHEQRIQMGYYANKYGIKAMRKKYAGVKESTSRDMRNYVLALVQKGQLSLDEPLANQLIPPKTRNGTPIHGSVAFANSYCTATPGPSSDPGPGPKQSLETKRQNDRRTLRDKLSTETPRNLSFVEKVHVGFLAVLQGSPLAMKKHNVDETTAKEYRNTVIELAQSGKLSLDIPLEEQIIPPEPNTARPAKRKKLGRPRKYVGENLENGNLPQQSTVGRMTTRQTERQTPSVNTVKAQTHVDPSESQHGGRGNREVQPNLHDCKSLTESSTYTSQRIKNDVSLETDLTFLRWKNRRISLGFQSDQAFAMHLMDVHDAFCGQCSGGGRHEHQNGT